MAPTAMMCRRCRPGAGGGGCERIQAATDRERESTDTRPSVCLSFIAFTFAATANIGDRMCEQQQQQQQHNNQVLFIGRRHRLPPPGRERATTCSHSQLFFVFFLCSSPAMAGAAFDTLEVFSQRAAKRCKTREPAEQHSIE
ncbi:hypothetical protein GPALN_007480 [Globodera pallida]|nr:hypothetical protein GPALN_007480 [Globodera pallida]